jgi:hypothetical protein
MSLFLAPLALCLLWGAPRDPEVGTGPQPAPRPVAWELEFKFLDPRRIEIQLPGSDHAEAYWYVVYTVTNPGPRSQRFFPWFQIVTEDLRVHETDLGISPLVFEAIRERHKVTHKYLVEPTKVIGAVLSGDDYARESVAIWRNIDLTLNSFSVYVSGLSGELQFLPNPAFDPKKPEKEVLSTPDGRQREVVTNPERFTLRKTLEIRYNLPGSPAARPDVEPERGAVRWVMR